MTAVITKYKSTFDRWVLANPAYPNPVHISCEDDIGELEFWYVFSCGNVSRVFNYRRVREICRSRIILRVAIIAKTAVETREWNRNHKFESVRAVWISDLYDANSYMYSEVIVGRSAIKLRFGDKIYMACQARCVPFVPKPHNNIT